MSKGQINTRLDWLESELLARAETAADAFLAHVEALLTDGEYITFLEWLASPTEKERPEEIVSKVFADSEAAGLWEATLAYLPGWDDHLLFARTGFH